MKHLLIITLTLLIANSLMAMPTYNQAIGELDKLNKDIKNRFNNTPVVYDFQSRFDQNSSVSYTGQTLRLTLITSLKSYMNSKNRSSFSGTREQAMNALNSYFLYSSTNRINSPDILKGFSNHDVTAKDLNDNILPILEGPIFNSIYSKTPSENLIEKIAGNDKNFDGKLKGWSSNKVSNIQLSTVDTDKNGDSFVEPEDLVTAFYKVLMSCRYKTTTYAEDAENQRA